MLEYGKDGNYACTKVGESRKGGAADELPLLKENNIPIEV
jgi:hypothetical protein